MKIELNKVYNCDCRDLMLQMIKDGIKADWLIADPPYGINYDKKANNRAGKRHGKAGATSRDYGGKVWDTHLSKDYFDLMFQCSENQIIWGGAIIIRTIYHQLKVG